MAKYKLTSEGIQDIETMRFIPDSSTNRDWRKYQAWLAEGNAPEPEFTAEELAAQKQRKKRQIEIAIVDMRLRKNAANIEGFTGLEAETQAELGKLRAELAKGK